MKKSHKYIISLLFAILILDSYFVQQSDKSKEYTTQATPTTAISNVDLTYSLSSQQTSLTMFIEYIQTAENATRFTDKVIITGDHSGVFVSDSSWKPALLQSTEYDVDTDSTEIIFQLENTLQVGERFTIVLVSALTISSAIDTHILDTAVNWTQETDISVKILLDSNLILQSISPEAHTISISEHNKLQLNWNWIDVDSFQAILSYRVSLTDLPVIITPSSWNLGYIKRNPKPIKQQFTIINFFDQYVNVTILNNNEWITIPKSIRLEPTSEQIIEVEADVSQIGEFEGQISLITDVSPYFIVCPVSVIVEPSTNVLLITAIILSVLLIIAVISLTIVLRKTRIEGERILRIKDIDINYDLDIEKLDGILKEKEIIIFREIVQNPGITQSQLGLEVGMSKATISRILSKLEGRELITKKNVGMSNLIYVNDKSSIFEYLKK